MKRIRRLNRNQSGQALVEFALTSIIFFIIVLGLVDVARATWNYNTLAQATREGVRYAMVHGGASSDPSGPGSAYYEAPSSDTKVEEAVEKFAGGLDLSGLSVQAEWLDGSNAPGSSIRVTAAYDYEPIFGFLNIFPVDLTMTSSSTMKISH